MKKYDLSKSVRESGMTLADVFDISDENSFDLSYKDVSVDLDKIIVKPGKRGVVMFSPLSRGVLINTSNTEKSILDCCIELWHSSCITGGFSVMGLEVAKTTPEELEKN